MVRWCLNFVVSEAILLIEMILYICALILAVAIFIYLVKPLSYWSNRGVPQTKPWLFFGDIWIIVFGRMSWAHFLQWLYNLYPNEKFVGLYGFTRPILLLRDPELIRQVYVKDFEHFTDHKPFLDPDADPLWANALFSLPGERWKDMRNLVSPTFTTSKIKSIYEMMIGTAETFVEHFNRKNEDIIEVNIEDAFTRYTNDVIATTAFGLKVDSLNEPENTFYLMGQKITSVRGLVNKIKIVCQQEMPTLFKYLGTTFLDPEAGKYFYQVVDDTIKVREEKKIVRQDIIHLLLEARKNQSGVDEYGKPKKIVEITNKDITSQAVIFFFAGFDTVSRAMCFGSHELALNADIQDRLRQEITQIAKNGRKVSYEDLQNMKYMDMVVSEILRKWPPFPNLDRLCTKPYTLQRSENETPIHLKKGQEMWVPIYALQRDPKYFPNPDKFDPERFSDENKNTIVPYTFMPFGVGPRICVGNRFAQIEIKALFFNLLLNYEIVPTKKTQLSTVLKKDFVLGIEGGFHLGLKRIK